MGMSELVIKLDQNLPPEGTWPAKCTHVVFLDGQPSAYAESGFTDQVELTFELATDDGPHSARRRYTRSLNPRASLRKALDAWRGRALSGEEERHGVDFAQLIDAPCHVEITHVVKGDRTFGNITGIAP